MYVLFIVLNKVEYLQDILTRLRNIGIRGATVIESMGSVSVLDDDMYNISITGGLLKALEGENKMNNVIFSLIEREEQVNRAMDEVEKVLGDMTSGNKGIMFTLPVKHFRGGELERHIESRENKKILKKAYNSEYY